MALLHQVKVNGVRNLAPLSFKPSPFLNLFYGANGSGKTSVLEAIHLLATGKSFRTQKVKAIIGDKQASFSLYGEVNDSRVPMGITRQLDGVRKIKVAGESVTSAAELATLLPLQLIEPHSFKLLEGSPQERRQFLDWGVFHVEHGFINAWKKFRRALNQRNIILKSPNTDINSSILNAWNEQLIQASDQVDQYRASYIKRLLPLVNEILATFESLPELTISYYRGWDKDIAFEEILKGGIARDIEQGYTLMGPQRADIKVRCNRMNITERFSRGQLKLVVISMKLAQGVLLSKEANRNCVYLLDDLSAELDKDHRKALCVLLESLKCQVFATGVSRESLYDFSGSDMDNNKVFHVEHGKLQQV
jgi:DNA replication and repair protein RecF